MFSPVRGCSGRRWRQRRLDRHVRGSRARRCRRRPGSRLPRYQGAGSRLTAEHARGRGAAGLAPKQARLRRTSGRSPPDGRNARERTSPDPPRSPASTGISRTAQAPRTGASVLRPLQHDEAEDERRRLDPRPHRRCTRHGRARPGKPGRPARQPALQVGGPLPPRRAPFRRGADGEGVGAPVLPGAADAARAGSEPARALRPRHHERVRRDGLPRRDAGGLWLRRRFLRGLRADGARGGAGGQRLPLRLQRAVEPGDVPDPRLRLGGAEARSSCRSFAPASGSAASA